MSPNYKPIPTAPFLRGLNASTDPYTQPKGTFPRGSNFLLNKRGALDVCDGSQIIDAFNALLQANAGKILAETLFAPTSVAPYYMLLKQALTQPLGAPRNLTIADGGAGGGLTGTFFYKVTALDGAGGETTASNEVTIILAANHKATLTWNVVPNAQSYNVYRSTTTGTEILMTGPQLPVAQPSPLTTTVTFTDDGTTNTAGFTVNIASISNPYPGFPRNFLVTTVAPHKLAVGQTAAINGVTPATFNIPGGDVVLNVFTSTSFQIKKNVGTFPPQGSSGTGGTVSTSTSGPPIADTTQQTALYQMPLSGISYNDANIVALFPATLNALGVPPMGTSGSTQFSNQKSTPNGGIPGMVSLLPQFVQFTNRMVMALGNGYPPQAFSDPNTTVNPAFVGSISGISVDANGVVTITTFANHGLFPVASQVLGTNVLIQNVLNAAYNTNGNGASAFVVIAIPATNQVQVVNTSAIGQAASSGGTMTLTTIPLFSTFVPGFPTWAATVLYNTNSIVQPSPTNGHFYKAIQGGTSGGVQPAFPTTTGQQVSDGSIIWQEAGLTNTAAPPPPGAAHLWVYAGSLWLFNTSTVNTANGIDGPCSLRMSDVNNLNSYNPLNQAFLDKDDGSEGMGLASFTITAQGIPPEGSLAAFKNYASYQIVGVFGSPQLTIQRIKTDMGCLAPRTIQFVPGFGIKRFTHLGIAVFDGVEDKITSEEIRPFIIPTGDFSESDITVLDSSWQAVMWGFQTAKPPMYCFAMPIGSSSAAKLTRIMCFDLVLKSWTAPIDLPFAISSAGQFRSAVANPITLFGAYSSSELARWQAGDAQWDILAVGVRSPSQILWNVKLPEAVSQAADQKLNCRRVAIRGINTSALTPITVTPVVNGTSKFAQSYTIPLSGDFEVFASFMYDGLRFSAIVAGSGRLEIDRAVFHVSQKSVGAKAVVS